MNNLKDIHNSRLFAHCCVRIVLSGFQWTIWRIYTTMLTDMLYNRVLFYQDFNEQFEGYTQLLSCPSSVINHCFIRISMNNLKDIHNACVCDEACVCIVLSGFQWTIWRIYTTTDNYVVFCNLLFYQDFNEQFEGYTQRFSNCVCCVYYCFIRISMNNLKDIHNTLQLLERNNVIVLSGFQWTIWRIYTTRHPIPPQRRPLFYQDFNEQFEGYTQLLGGAAIMWLNCFIRISMNNLKDIHNAPAAIVILSAIVLSGFQWTIWRTYTTRDELVAW